MRLRLPGLTLEVRVELPLLALLAHGVVFQPLHFTLFGILASTFSNLHVVQGTEGNSGLLAFWPGC